MSWVVCFTLIAGGAVLLWVDQLEFKPKYHDVMQFSLPMCLIIGFCQCFAMIPGVSRSGATIVSAMLLGADKRSAAEFSFFLAMPTMAGAFTLDLIKNHDQMTSHNVTAGRDRVRLFVRGGLFRGQDVSRLRLAPRLCAVRMVARDRRLYRLDPARDRLLTHSGEAAGAELAGLAEAPEITRHDRLVGRRRDAEPLQRTVIADRVLRHHIVAAQQLDLVRRQRRVRQELQEPGLSPWPVRTAAAPACRDRSVTASTYSMISRMVRTSGPPNS